ncbi:MAG: TIGR03000 domain-containing protein [Planctomycetes bacterium]|nr:TIGR03000 domain-containing protein [Planctomycetota bacterium]
MSSTHLRAWLAAFAMLIGLIGSASAQDKADAKADPKTDKKAATIKILLPETLYKPAEVRIEGVLTKQSGAERSFVTPPLDAGKVYIYKVEAVIEPNNYTKIIRTREVNFKAGEELTVDLRKKDDKIADDVRIRWVPTPKDIVKKMGELAKIGKEDVVCDLGCGDAVMIITAVKEMGAKKGIGIDIDPKRVSEAKENAKTSGIADKIEIREGNILKLDAKDLADVNVMMLYLGDEMNIRLRPMLWNALKPGTRIVSHRFIMGDWKPEKTITVKGEDNDEYTLHVWTITGKEKDGKFDKKVD